MNMSDADTGEVLWEDTNWDDLLTERDIHIPASILRCRGVSREFQFSSREQLDGLRLEQRIFLRGNLMEGAPWSVPPAPVSHAPCAAPSACLLMHHWLLCAAEWYFHFGFVIPNSTNTWQQTIEAAEESKMLPAAALDGNVLIETAFFDDDVLVCKMVLRVFYDA